MNKQTKVQATKETKALAALTTVSSKIRYLDAAGYTRSEIAAKLGKRYQHVRNVLITPVATPKK